MKQGHLEELLRLAGNVGNVNVETVDGAVILRVTDLRDFSLPGASAGDPALRSKATKSGHVPLAPSGPAKPVDARVSEMVDRIAEAQKNGDETITLSLPEDLSPADLEAIERHAEAFGDVEVTGDPDSGLRVSNLKIGSEFTHLPMEFRSGVRRALNHLAHEGPLGEEGDLIAVEVEESGMVLATLIDPRTHRIHHASHRGTASLPERAIMEEFCRTIEGLPVQDAADYAGFKLINRLRDKTLKKSVPGVMMTVNTDPVFHRPVEMARCLRKVYGAETGFTDVKNFYESPPSETWVEKPEQAKTKAVETAIQDYARHHGLNEGDISFSEITRSALGFFIRVIVSFAPDVGKSR